MIRYYLHGLEIPRDAALKVWMTSRTYRRAALKDAIWPDAEAAIHNGAMPKELANHLREAGISMEKVNAELEPEPEHGPAALDRNEMVIQLLLAGGYLDPDKLAQANAIIDQAIASAGADGEVA